MLVLTRKIDERIVIGDDIVVTVVGIRGDRVRLGIRCPAEIPVHREEVSRRIHDEYLAGPPVEMPEPWHECVDAA